MKNSQNITIFLVTCMFLATLNEVACFTFSYTTFNQSVTDDFIKNDNSYIVQNAIQVTPDSGSAVAPMTNRSGKVLYHKTFKLWNKTKIASFNTTFVLNIDPTTDEPGDRHGGDGIAFILAKDPDLPPNSAGQWLGLVNANTNNATQSNIVAIEFDTKKSFPQDLDDNHVGLNINSIFSYQQRSLNDSGIRILDGTDLNVTINYDGTNKTMNVFVSSVSQSGSFNANFSIDLSVYLPSEVYVGFSGSTGTGSEKNCVRSWFFNGEDIDIGSPKQMLWAYIVFPILFVGLLLFCCVVVFLYRRKRQQDQVKDVDDIDMKRIETGLGPQKFKLKELKRATSNFNPKNELGRGGFAVVYRGTLGMKEVAVKRITNTRRRKQDFIAEVTTIGTLRHKNLVELIGWCFEKSELLLVYEYMPNGSLDKYISTDDEHMVLDWWRRHGIICGVAQSLDYLHHECSKKVLHRDIKTSNVMLDSEFNARLGDFGLARILQQREQTHHSTKELMGTPGYMAPELFHLGHSTAETDVFAFGVLVLVVATGRMPGAQNSDGIQAKSIVDLVWERYNSKMVLSVIDQKLKGKFEEGQAESMILLGLACCHPNPYERPSMRTALQVLVGEAHPPFVPSEKPVFMWPATLPSIESLNLVDSYPVDCKNYSVELSPR